MLPWITDTLWNKKGLLFKPSKVEGGGQVDPKPSFTLANRVTLRKLLIIYNLVYSSVKQRNNTYLKELYIYKMPS